jgi:hypothetical protein
LSDDISLRRALDADLKEFHGQFPGMFADPRFAQLDREPKARVHEKLTSALSRERYLAFLQRDAIREIAGFLAAAVRGVGDLLHRTESKDITTALRSESRERARLVRELFYLLWAPADFHVRAYRYIASAKELKTGRTPKAFTWPTVTLIPWLLRPEDFALLKPIPSRAVARRYGLRLDYGSTPSAIPYEQWNTFCRKLLDALRPYGAIDLMDVHSFLWRIHSPVV